MNLKSIIWIIIFGLSGIWIVIFGLTSCQKENDKEEIISYLDSIKSDRYYNDEAIFISYPNIYGIWKLSSIDGGYLGGPWPLDFDYLEIKRIGIYGLIRNDTLFKYGKITPFYDTAKNTDSDIYPIMDTLCTMDLLFRT